MPVRKNSNGLPNLSGIKKNVRTVLKGQRDETIKARQDALYGELSKRNPTKEGIVQRKLELQAKEEEKRGGKYIRPIVLFQAQPRNGKDFSRARAKRNHFGDQKAKRFQTRNH